MKHSFFGVGGTITALSLHDWSDVASAAAGVATFVYMLTATVLKLRKKHK